MFSNAVSSAVGRLYASAVNTAEPRLQVQRVEAIARLTASGDGAPSAASADHGEREHAAQRLALTNGVRSVFESAAGVDSLSLESSETSATQAEAAAAAPRDDESAADPQLEEAILRFIHAVFRSLAEAEGATTTDLATADSSRTHSPGFSHSREALGSRIEALAHRLEAAGDESDPLHDDGTNHLAGAVQRIAGGVQGAADETAAGDELAQSFSDVLRALGVKVGNSGSSDDSQPATQPPTRGALVNLMHRLAQAMQGAPPVDEGLPTLGGLLHARA